MWVLVSFCMIAVVGLWWMKFTSYKGKNFEPDLSSIPQSSELDKKIDDISEFFKKANEAPAAENSQKEIEGIAKDYIEENNYLGGGSVFDLKLERIERKNDEWHLEYNQYYKNIPVNENTVSFIISEAEKKVISSSSSFDPKINLGTDPKITNQEAYEKIVKSLEIENMENPELKSSKLVIYKIDKDSADYRLAWKINAVLLQPYHNYFYFIDAKNGKVISRYERN